MISLVKYFLKYSVLRLLRTPLLTSFVGRSCLIKLGSMRGTLKVLMGLGDLKVVSELFKVWRSR